MRKSIIAASFALATATLATGLQAQELDLENDQDKLSYGLGVLISESLKQQDYGDLNLDLLVQAIRENSENKAQMTPDDAREALQTQQRRIQDEKAVAAKAAGQAFLDENAKKEGVKVTDSGLQYEVINSGEGDKPGIEDTVKVHYVGTLEDGTEFDSSVARGEPTQFPLKGVIPGWTEGLQLMPVGSKYRFVIPSDLAYGDRGAGPQIGPNTTLVFEVELLEIVK